MRSLRFLLLLLLPLTVLAKDNDAPTTKVKPSELSTARSLFVKNEGQFSDATKYLLRSGLFEASFEDAMLRIRASRSDASITVNELTLRFAGGREVQPTGVIPGKAVHRYFRTNEQTNWTRSAPTYHAVQYTNVYDGISAKFYIGADRLKADYVVAPYSDPTKIKLHYDGARNIAISEEGGLIFSFDDGELYESAPIAYQSIDGKKKSIEVAFALDGNEVSFALGAYDPSRELVIDPALKYATYLGGSQTEYIDDIKLDKSGNFYVAGHTYSSGFVTKGEQGGTDAHPRVGHSDVFVAKFSPKGELVYSSVIGGALSDNLNGFDVDAQGNVYIGGSTGNDDLSTAERDGWPLIGDIGNEAKFAGGFLARLDPNGILELSGVLNDTFATGSVLGLKVSPNGTVLVNGVRSSHYPRVETGPNEIYSETLNFATLNADLRWQKFFRFMYNQTTAKDIDIDEDGSIYFIGNTQHASLPVTSSETGFQFNGERSGFIVRTNPSFEIRYALYLGGTGSAYIHNMALSSFKEPTITGYLNGPRFNATKYTSLMHDGAEEGTEILYVFQLSATGDKARFITRVGRQFSAAYDAGSPGIALDADNEIMICGYSSRASLPLMNAMQSEPTGTWSPYILKLNETGDTVRYGSFLGEGRGYYAAMTPGGTMYAAGHTNTSSIPTNDKSHQREYSAGANADDAWIGIIGDTCATTVRTTADSGPNSLRQILECVNRLGDPATIEFDIPTSDPGFANGVYTIKLARDLPAINTMGVSIDGTTQTKIANSNASGPEIQITTDAALNSLLDLRAPNGSLFGLTLNGADNAITVSSENAFIADCYIGTDPTGTSAAPNDNGIQLSSNARNALVKNNLISGNRQVGILVSIDHGGHEIVQNTIGTDRTGTKRLGNHTGILIDNSSGTIIGDSTGGRNLISGNQTGIHIKGTLSHFNRVIHNYIGVDSSGQAAVYNVNGITLEEDSATIIGGNGAKYRNVISGNRYMNIFATGSTGVTISGNFIGIDRTGSNAVIGTARTQRGIELRDCPNSHIGTIAPLSRNVISGNRDGVVVSGAGSINSVITNNYIGLSADGLSAVGNSEYGVQIKSCYWVSVGLPVAGRGNVISGNGMTGLKLVSNEGPTYGCYVLNNFIGTDAFGNAAVPNGAGGVLLTNASACTIGGTRPEDRNIISGNGTLGGWLGGLSIVGPGARQNEVYGNRIGVNAAGDPLPNEGTNVLIRGGSNNRIGGPDIVFGNTIIGASSNGILIESADGRRTPTAGNEIMKNIITKNRRGVLLSRVQENFVGKIRESDLVGNLIDQAEQGVFVFQTSMAKVLSNRMMLNDTCISIFEGPESEIIWNTMERSKTGLVVKRTYQVYIEGNTFEENTGNTGVHLYDGSATITANRIVNDEFSGVVVENDATALMRNNWLSGNKMFGAEARDASAFIDAEMNWWGHPGGPDEGDRINGNIDANPWLTQAPTFKAIALRDTQYVAVGDSAELLVGAISLDGAEHTVDIHAEVQGGFITHSRTGVTIGDMIGSAIPFEAPATEGAWAAHYVVRKGQTEDSAHTVIITYTPALAVLAIAPDTMQIEFGQEGRFTKIGFDQHDALIQTAPTWSSPDMTVAASGRFTAPSVTGLYKVIATQNGISDTGYVQVGEPLLAVARERVERPALALYPNPASGSITVMMPREARLHLREAVITVLDVTGREIIRTAITTTAAEHTLDLTDLAPGTYQVILTSGTNVWSSAMSVVR